VSDARQEAYTARQAVKAAALKVILLELSLAAESASVPSLQKAEAELDAGAARLTAARTALDAEDAAGSGRLL
jgi:hypothetical protein